MKNKRKFYIYEDDEEKKFLHLNKNKTSKYSSRKKKYIHNKIKKNDFIINFIIIFIIITIVFLVIKIKNSKIIKNIQQINQNNTSLNNSELISQENLKKLQ